MYGKIVLTAKMTPLVAIMVTQLKLLSHLIHTISRHIHIHHVLYTYNVYLKKMSEISHDIAGKRHYYRVPQKGFFLVFSSFYNATFVQQGTSANCSFLNINIAVSLLAVLILIIEAGLICETAVNFAFTVYL